MYVDPIGAGIAALASFRLTDIILVDKIAEPLRKRIGYLATCQRCISVWSGVACTIAYIWAPYLLWPLALSWGYLWVVHTMTQRRAPVLPVNYQPFNGRPVMAKNMNEQVQAIMGAQAFQIASLQTQLEEANEKIAEMTKAYTKPVEPKHVEDPS